MEGRNDIRLNTSSCPGKSAKTRFRVRCPGHPRPLTHLEAGPSVSEGGGQRPARDENQDQRAHGPQGGAHVVGLRGEIGGKVQEPRYDVAVQQPLRERERRRGQNKKQAGNEEERQVIETNRKRKR